ncbi:hypothetical protein [uncultured Megasphaera sp.]|uniref:hypothetical protein n=1 Tax=uncultured Megasphaera sp. TaxID=165188 RepID=UPI0025E13985|nr:hypothetical protein [uncultured Megasphaera sp.]
MSSHSCPIPKRYSHVAIHAHRHIIHHAAPQSLIELCHRLARSALFVQYLSYCGLGIEGIKR